MNALYTLFFVFLPLFLTAQVEICFNQLDDDGDGLIDCYDPECYCAQECDDHYLNQCQDSCKIPATIDPVFELRQYWTYDDFWHSYNTPISGDIDNDGIPEIIGKRGPFRSGSFIEYDEMVVIDGLNGTLDYQFNIPAMKWAAGSVGIADMDNNGFCEIVMVNGNFFNGENYCEIHAYEFNGTSFTKKWTSDESAYYATKSNNQRYKPQFADFNSDGIAEVYLLDKIFDGATGKLLIETGDTKYLGKPFKTVFSQQHTIAADILDDAFCTDCEGTELIIGSRIYSVHIDRINPSNCRLIPQITCPREEDGINGVVDVDGDGDLDLILLYGNLFNETIIVTWDGQTETELCPAYSIPSERGYCGLPTLDDFDNNGAMDMALCSFERFSTFEFTPSGWILKWQKRTTDGSGQTGCTAFDFNGDNKIEVIYRDESSLRIFNGADGAELYDVSCTSGTGDEYPVVVDVDNDNQAEILVSCGNDLVCYESAGFRWRNTREVWNQHIFHNTNVNDDLTIPGFDQNRGILDPLLGLNTFQIPYGWLFELAPDLSIEILDLRCDNGDWIAVYQICNLGAVANAGNINIDILGNDPFMVNQHNLLASNSFNITLNPDSCFIDSLNINFNGDSLFFFVNTQLVDGSIITPGAFPYSIFEECNAQNNYVANPIKKSPNLDPLKDTTICNGSEIVIGYTNMNLNYRWSTGDSTASIQISKPGKYFVTITDDCGRTTLDSMCLEFGSFEKRISIEICANDTISIFNKTYTGRTMDTLNLTGAACDTILYVDIALSEVQWPLPIIENPCDADSNGAIEYIDLSSESIFGYNWSNGKSSAEISNLKSGQYIVTITDTNFCTIIDTINITDIVIPPLNINIDRPDCKNDFVGTIDINPTDSSVVLLNGESYSSAASIPVTAGEYKIRTKKEGCYIDTTIFIRNIDTFNADIVTFTFNCSQDILWNPQSQIGNYYNFDSIRLKDISEYDAIAMDRNYPLKWDEMPEFLFLIDTHGCEYELDFQANFEDDESIFIPNVFTPNGDNINDEFRVYTNDCIKQIKSLKIFSRWGELLFEAYDFIPNEISWDGQLNSEDMRLNVFTYSLCYQNLQGEDIFLNGSVTLLK